MEELIIKVEPDNKIFRELGNNTYEYVDLLAELIDNSIAAKYHDKPVNISIEIGYSKVLEKVEYLLVADDAKGIDEKIIGQAISPAALSGGRSLNEHGLGMKQAIAALGELEYLKTKTNDSDYELIINEFKFGNIRAKKNYNVDYSSGTEIKINNVIAKVPFSPQAYTQGVVVKLGAMYRRYLRSENKRANINICLKNVDKNQKGELIDNNIHNWDVKEIKPIYFHPNQRKNEPVIVKKKFIGRDWEAHLTFGYAPTESQYEEMGLIKPKNYHPYSVSVNKQGLDIIRNDRIIKMHQLVEIGLVRTRHNKYNYIRGELDLIKGFTTATTKNNIIEDRNFVELLEKVRIFLNDREYLSKKTYSSALPEKLLQNRLKNFFKTSVLYKKEKVQTEYAIEGLGGYIDILADGEAWELKTGQASGLDVYQLFAYMDMGDIEKGYLLANEFTTGAESAVEHINKKHKKDIKIVSLLEFPINDPPSDEELKKFY